MSLEQLNLFLLVGSAVLIAAILAVRVSVGLGMPSLMVYLLIGVALGDAGLGIRFSDAKLAEILGVAALVVILAEGGFTTRWSTARSAFPIATLLATFGVAISVGVLSTAAHFLLHLHWQLALLLGAAVSSTDAAAVFSVLRRVPLLSRISAIVEVESGMNDPLAVLLVMLVVEQTGFHLAGFVLDVVYQLAAGVAIGLVVGAAGAWLIRRVALPASGLYPVAVLAACVLAYGGGAMARASGFAAVFVAGLVLGNSDLPHGPANRSFAEGAAWLAQIGMFVMLGLLVSPKGLGAALVPAVVAGVILTFVARPFSVAVCSLPFKVPIRHQMFISWAGLRGAVPIVLATIPLAAGIADAQMLFNVVFLLVVVFVVVQAPTLPMVSRWCGVANSTEPAELEVEVAPLGELSADLLEVVVAAGSKLHGVAVSELRLPRAVSVALVVRDGTSFVPAPDTLVRRGDRLLVVTPRPARAETVRRLRAVTRAGRLAGWLGERGEAAGGDG